MLTWNNVDKNPIHAAAATVKIQALQSCPLHPKPLPAPYQLQMTPCVTDV